MHQASLSVFPVNRRREKPRHHHHSDLFFPLDRMAAQLKQLQSKACQAKQFLSTHGSVYYKDIMEKNKQYVQSPATVEKCNELSKQLFYTRLARFTL
nr:putative ATPase, F0 complex, subunit G [Tanacetum cinerariifolium]